MAKKIKELTPAQAGEVKRMWLQKTDAEIADFLGADERQVARFLKAEKLVRSAYTLKKFAKKVNDLQVESEEIFGQE